MPTMQQVLRDPIIAQAMERLSSVESSNDLLISRSKEAVDFLRLRYADIDWSVEHLFVFYIHGYKRVLETEVAATGTPVKASINVYPILRKALLLGANAIAVAHNHPGGRAEPSEMDMTFTQYLRKACSFLELRLIDSIVFSKNGDYKSMMFKMMEERT